MFFDFFCLTCGCLILTLGMMKRIILFFFVFCFVMQVVYSQDFEPGTQAQGYLAGRNATVDYATGIFHYRVPLFTIGKGSVTLPISLDYAAKGVKSEDRPGLVGYNWTLNTGGIVTRTIRGGIADEDPENGFLETERDSVPLWEDAVAVNKRERDGECDIFTVVFNGRSLYFIIRMDDEGEIYAQPLEQTHVRIECETNVQKEIMGWIVTDESGNRYIYRQVEWSADIVNEEAVSFNGVRGKSYISSWYLSRIEPYNGKPIVFYYREEVRKSGTQNGIITTHEGGSYMAKYTYGRPIQEHPFDFSKYRSDFNSCIDEAMFYLNNYSIQQQINNPLYIFVGNSEWVRNPNFEAGVEAINANFRVMGQLSSFTNIGSASSELINVLNQLYDTYKNSSSHNARMAASAFNAAKGIVINCLNEVQEVTTKEVYEGSGYSIRSPMLDYIISGEDVIEFVYFMSGNTCKIENIRRCNMLGDLISEVDLSSYTNLSRLDFRDKDSLVVSTISFDYHGYAAGGNIYDLWGYYKSSIGEEGEEYLPNVDGEHAKVNSLKTIYLPDGGEIGIDYESNQIRYLNSSQLVDYGGIRVKKLTFSDPKSNKRDTLYYRYPYGGSLLTSYTNFATVRYSGFSDRIAYSRMRPVGSIFVSTGNNGIYYKHVQEIRPGYGMRAYLFSVWEMLYNGINLNLYWKNGLPLAVADYDDSGHLVRLIKNCYYLGGLSYPLLPESVYYAAGYFTEGDSAMQYGQFVRQLKAYEYYIDRESVEAYYRGQDNIFLYQDGYVVHYLNPYGSFYLPNISPRTNVSNNEPGYALFYGGKVLLKSQSVYHFADTVDGLLTVEDFGREDEGILDSQTEYFYDRLPVSLFSTRKKTIDSRGVVYWEITRHVNDVEDSTMPALEKMKEANALSYVVKTDVARDSILMEARVSLYETYAFKERDVAVLSEKKVYYPAEEELVSQSDVLYSYQESNYISEGKI